MLTKLLLLRHGEPEQTGCLLGHTDLDLSDLGYRNLRVASQNLGSISVVASSPLKRCACFAADFVSENNIEIELDVHWKECFFGDWDGLKYQQIAADFPKEYQNFLTNPVNNTPPNGERLRDFHHRVMVGLSNLLERHGGKTILLVTHGGVIRTLIAWCLNIDFLNQRAIANTPFQRIKVDYASLSQIDIWQESYQSSGNVASITRETIFDRKNLLPQLALLNQRVRLNQPTLLNQ
ncbi:MAG: histidine phosphatase family protein [Kangiellaceae bacterium]|nr:histidine phosphatase family protein [Kangiellaceae bacterium]